MSYYEQTLGFEEISRTIIRKKKPNLYILTPATLLAVGFISTLFSHFTEKDGSSPADILFYLIPATILILINLIDHSSTVDIYLFSGYHFTFYANSPYKYQVDQFIQQLLTKQKDYLLNRYAKYDPYLSPEQQSNNLNWLWNKKIIDDSELVNLRNQLLSQPSNSPAGFKLTPPSLN